MIERKVTTGIFKKNGEYMNVYELVGANYLTPEGQELQQIPRFESFIQGNIPTHIWSGEGGVGPHGNIFDHQVEQLKETDRFIRGCPGIFTEAQVSQLYSIAPSHDMGEHRVGDVKFDEKTDGHHKLEMQALFEILNDSLHDEVEVFERGEYIESVIDALSDTKTKVGEAYYAVERIGYMNAAFYAWGNIEGPDSDLQRSLKLLAHQVVPSHIPEMVRLAKKYPYLDYYLTENLQLIKDIMNDSLKDGTAIKKQYKAAERAFVRFEKSHTKTTNT